MLFHILKVLQRGEEMAFCLACALCESSPPQTCCSLEALFSRAAREGIVLSALTGDFIVIVN